MTDTIWLSAMVPTAKVERAESDDGRLVALAHRARAAIQHVTMAACARNLTILVHSDRILTRMIAHVAHGYPSLHPVHGLLPRIEVLADPADPEMNALATRWPATVRIRPVANGADRAQRTRHALQVAPRATFFIGGVRDDVGEDGEALVKARLNGFAFGTTGDGARSLLTRRQHQVAGGRRTLLRELMDSTAYAILANRCLDVAVGASGDQSELEA